MKHDHKPEIRIEEAGHVGSALRLAALEERDGFEAPIIEIRKRAEGLATVAIENAMCAAGFSARVDALGQLLARGAFLVRRVEGWVVFIREDEIAALEAWHAEAMAALGVSSTAELAERYPNAIHTKGAR
jgi:hypothetical protein